MNELYALLGFLAEPVAALFVDRARETRKRIVLVRVVESQLQAFIGACESVLSSRAFNSFDVENYANCIVQTFQSQPELIAAAHTERTRKALWNTFAEVGGTLSLISVHRDELSETGTSVVLDVANYQGVVKRSRETLRLRKKSR